MKYEIQNEKQTPMSEIQNTKQYDLEERTFLFAKNVRSFVRKLPKTIANIEDGKQLINASGSVGANYIEAKESKYWLRLVFIDNNTELEKERKQLVQEATELTNK
jgi:hypothetical protein